MSSDESPETLAGDLQRRLDGFREFAAWERDHASVLPPDLAIEAATGLYDLLPPSSRRRPVDPSGVIFMHRQLRVLMPSR